MIKGFTIVILVCFIGCTSQPKEHEGLTSNLDEKYSSVTLKENILLNQFGNLIVMKNESKDFLFVMDESNSDVYKFTPIGDSIYYFEQMVMQDKVLYYMNSNGVLLYSATFKEPEGEPVTQIPLYKLTDFKNLTVYLISDENLHKSDLFFSNQMKMLDVYNSIDKMNFDKTNFLKLKSNKNYNDLFMISFNNSRQRF